MKQTGTGETMKTLAQGDLLFRKVARKPAFAKRVQHNGVHVLALGETTGHAHVVTVAEPDDLTVWLTDDDATFLQIAGEGIVKHAQPNGDPYSGTPDHAPVVLPAGIWEVRRQRQYVRGEIQRVAD